MKELLKLVLIFVILVCSVTLAQGEINFSPPDFGNSFHYLEKFNADGVTVMYNKENTEIINKSRYSFPKDDKLFADEMPGEDRVLLKTEIAGKKYYIIFSWGPSEDPAFRIYKDDKELTYIGSIGGAVLVVPGSASLYGYARHNGAFGKRSKYKMEKNKITEVKQPFYYVGLTSATLKPVKLYDKIDGGNVVASLPANYEVEILVAESAQYGSAWYLVRTSFGLTGWAKLDQGYGSQPSVKGLIWHGD